MVRKLSELEKAEIAAAVAIAERRTSAEIAVVIEGGAKGSLMKSALTGLVVGGVLGIMTYPPGSPGFHHLPLIMLVSTMIWVLRDLRYLWVSPVDRWLNRLQCRDMVDALAARAAAEYMALTDQLPPAVPVVLFYISPKDRYAHIYTSRNVREKMPATVWDKVIAAFTGSVKEKGVKQACIDAVEDIGNVMEAVFPDDGKHSLLSNEIKEI